MIVGDRLIVVLVVWAAKPQPGDIAVCGYRADSAIKVNVTARVQREMLRFSASGHVSLGRFVNVAGKVGTAAVNRVVVRVIVTVVPSKCDLFAARMVIKQPARKPLFQTLVLSEKKRKVMCSIC